jgi:hypothetical protein
MTSTRGRLLLVDHVRLGEGQLKLVPGEGIPVTNFIHKATGAEDAWIQQTTETIGDWRSLLRSTYIRWTLTINGLELAAREYQSWTEDRRFKVDSMRVVSGNPVAAPLPIWLGAEAAENHLKTAELLAAYGACDLYGALEEVLFQTYRIFLTHHPLLILKGDEYKELRRVYAKYKGDPSSTPEWEGAWQRRLEDWHRKRSYDGLWASI